MARIKTGINSLLANAKRFLKNECASLSTMYALAAVPLVIAAGAAIDIARYNAAQTQIQAALDSGALAAAAAEGVSDSARSTLGKTAFDANMKGGVGGGLKPVATFKVDGKTIIADAKADMPTTLMSVVGITKLQVGGHAEVGMGQNKKAEIALVLDYSGSMTEVVGGQVKYVAMQKAAKNLIDSLSSSNPKNIKFGLVPFSHHVQVSLPGEYVLGGTAGTTWTGCTQDRQYPFNISDSTPTSAPGSKWGQPQAPVHADMGCSGYKVHNLRTMPLTDDFAGLKNQLDIMTPYAWTHIALGVEFGYHVLSPNAPFTGAADYADKNTQKFMVVLTDGMQTEPAFGPGKVRSVAQGEDNLTALCNSAKANGITMITMAFDLDDSATRKRLQGCASDPSKNFFVVSDGADLSAAFEAVRSAVTAQVFLSK